MIPPELIGAAISAGVGYIFKAHATAIDGLKQVAELHIKQQMTADQLANSAAERSDPKARKILAFIVYGSVFGGLIVMALASLWTDKSVVSIVKEVPQKEILWGLIRWGKTMQVVTANGLVFPEWLGWLIGLVGGFMFGTGAAKPAR